MLFRSFIAVFHNNLVLEDRYKLVLDGLKVTVIISILAAILGTILGGAVCSMRMSASPFFAAHRFWFC